MGNIPKLRFKEFSGDWDLTLVGSFLNERIEYPQGELPLYSLTIEKGITPKTERYERAFLVKNNYEYKVMKVNDFAFNPMNLRFGALARHKENFDVTVSKYYNIFYCNKNLNPNFAELYFTTYNTIQYYNKMATGSLEEKKRVHYKEFLKFKFPFPTILEQEKIASFLTSVDDKIKQLIKKEELLQQYKKSVIQKIFNQEIRFKDDDGSEFCEWEIKHLNQIAIKKSIKNKDNLIKTVLTNSAEFGIINQQEYFDKDIANQNNLEGYYVVDKDDFIYNPRISLKAPVGPMKRNKLGQGVMSPLYTVLEIKKGSKDFYEYFFDTTLWHRYMNQIANFGARFDRMNITNNDFMKMPLPFPSIEEQNKIANFLSSIDIKIEQTKKKLEQTKEFKKALLQQMFV